MEWGNLNEISAIVTIADRFTQEDKELFYIRLAEEYHQKNICKECDAVGSIL